MENVDQSTKQPQLDQPASVLVRLSTQFRYFQFATSRRILFSWIRPTILGCDKTYLDLKNEDLVCYVMPYRSTADLMVLDKACEVHNLPRPIESIEDIEPRAFFFLGHGEGRLGRKTLRRPSPRMLRLLKHQSHLEKEIKVVPVSIFWGHQPDREKSIFKLLLSENWTATSGFKKLLAGLFHPNHILVQFSKAVSLDELISTEQDEEKQNRKLYRLLRVHFNKKKQAIIGPDLSHRRTLINSIMHSPTVRESIHNVVLTEHKPLHEIEKRAFSYANEVASHQSYRVIRFFHVLLTWLWQKLYEGIEVNHIETAKELAESHEIVYIPCHRSHIDYLLLSFVLYQNGLTPPHIAAGKNLNLPVLGPLLRRGGAFFMRRSFQGDSLYKTVFDEYMHLMFTRGYSIEYFIEGGRSRTGRTLPPRTGMLRMTVRSFQRDSSKPIVFLPVYFGYERILEAATYMGELAGKSKQDESLFDIFSIFATFKHPFGKVAVNFGKPVELDQFLDNDMPGWRSRSVDPGVFAAACSKLSTTLAAHINAAAAVNPTNLVATAILATPKQVMQQQRLEYQVNILQSIARLTHLDEQITVTNLDARQVISHAEKVSGLERNNPGFGDIHTASQETAILLTYYRNNTLHVFVLASLVARVIQFEKSCDIPDILTVCRILHPHLKTELFLNWNTEDLERKCRQTLDVMASLGLVKLEEERVNSPLPPTEEYASLTELSEIVEPILERFHIVSALLQEEQKRSITALENAAAGIAHQLSAIHSIHSPEFFEKSLFARFINSLNSEGCINTSADRITLNGSFDELNQCLENYLDNDIRYNVLQAITQTANG